MNLTFKAIFTFLFALMRSIYMRIECERFAQLELQKCMRVARLSHHPIHQIVILILQLYHIISLMSIWSASAHCDTACNKKKMRRTNATLASVRCSNVHRTNGYLIFFFCSIMLSPSASMDQVKSANSASQPTRFLAML